MEKFTKIYNSIMESDSKSDEWSSNIKTKKEFVKKLAELMYVANDDNVSYVDDSQKSDYGKLGEVMKNVAGKTFYDNIIENGNLDWSLLS